ncbi:MAG: hypothetical protein E6Q36_08275 [Chryseobacterium sp.]|nr:MAG: hypothetical protein E6Q36_08275 [Chryseobacterium sp.]
MLDKTKGLTSSEASRVANFLKELVKGIDVNVDDFKIITSKALKEGKELPTDNNVRIEDWSKKLQDKAKYFSLSAWLKEAIKYKDRLFEEESNKHFNASTINSSDLLTYPEKPSKKDTSFESFFLNELDTRQQAEYLKEEAYAAHIGKFIHNFDTIREQLNNFEPTVFKPLVGGETLTVVRTLLYTKEELVEEHENLLKLHRESEKILNYYRAKHKEWVADIDRKYQIDLDEYTMEYTTVSNLNNKVVQTYRTAFENEKTDRLEELRQSKIVIPNELQPILDEVYEKLG